MGKKIVIFIVIILIISIIAVGAWWFLLKDRTEGTGTGDNIANDTEERESETNSKNGVYTEAEAYVLKKLKDKYSNIEFIYCEKKEDYYLDTDILLSKTYNAFIKANGIYVKYEETDTDYYIPPKTTEIKFNDNQYINSLFDNCLYTMGAEDSISFIFAENDWVNFEKKYRENIVAVVKSLDKDISLIIYITKDEKFKKDDNYKLLLAYNFSEIPSGVSIIKTPTGNGTEKSNYMYLKFAKEDDTFTNNVDGELLGDGADNDVPGDFEKSFSDEYLNKVFTEGIKRFLNY